MLHHAVVDYRVGELQNVLAHSVLLPEDSNLRGVLLADPFKERHVQAFLLSDGRLDKRIELIEVADHDEAIGDENRAESQRFTNLRGFIHDAVVKSAAIHTEEKVVVHLEAGGTKDIGAIEGLLDLLHRVKHRVGLHLIPQTFIYRVDIVSDSDKLCES